MATALYGSCTLPASPPGSLSHIAAVPPGCATSRILTSSCRSMKSMSSHPLLCIVHEGCRPASARFPLASWRSPSSNMTSASRNFCRCSSRQRRSSDTQNDSLAASLQGPGLGDDDRCRWDRRWHRGFGLFGLVGLGPRLSLAPRLLSFRLLLLFLLFRLFLFLLSCALVGQLLQPRFGKRRSARRGAARARRCQGAHKPRRCRRSLCASTVRRPLPGSSAPGRRGAT